jgi:hypothetical protein
VLACSVFIGGLGIVLGYNIAVVLAGIGAPADEKDNYVTPTSSRIKWGLGCGTIATLVALPLCNIATKVLAKAR